MICIPFHNYSSYLTPRYLFTSLSIVKTLPVDLHRRKHIPGSAKLCCVNIVIYYSDIIRPKQNLRLSLQGSKKPDYCAACIVLCRNISYVCLFVLFLNILHIHARTVHVIYFTWKLSVIMSYLQLYTIQCVFLCMLRLVF